MNSRRELTRKFSLIVALLAFAFFLLPQLLTLILKQTHPIIAERAALFRDAAFLTAKIAAVSGVFGILIGFAVGTFGLNSSSRVRRFPAHIYVWLLCGTPLLVQVLFFYYGLPAMIPGLELNEIQAGVCALALNVGAYNSTIIKSGLDAVSKQQYEAGISLGLSRFQVLRWIILPQAMRIALGPLLNNWVALLKDTSLVSAIGVAELTLTATRINSETFQPVPTLITVALLYLGMSSMLNLGVYLLREKSATK